MHLLTKPTFRTSTSIRRGCAKSDISLGRLAAVADSDVVEPPDGRCKWYGDERWWNIDDVVSRSDTLLHIHNHSQQLMNQPQPQKEQEQQDE